ncbi:UNVERIFIED_CONTAM: hypothetical protein FKN15_012732 [Acipenser sinensis]
MEYTFLSFSPVTESKEVYPDFPFENGNSGPAIELERHVGQHCHGRVTKTVESRETQLARKKLYIASVVCLIFMIGEVIDQFMEYTFLSFSPVTESKEVYPDFPFENGNSGPAIELERHVGQHCHGRVTKTVESRETQLARKKLYIASVVCLIFMIGEVIGGYLAHSLAIMTDAAHLLTDFGSMMPEYKVADPICTFLFSVFVLGTTVTILRDVFRILMEGAPKTIHFNSVKEVLLSLKGVKAMHSLRLWALTLSHTMLSVHIAIEEDADTQTVLKEATALLQNKFGFYSTTIQVENYCEDMSHCTQCQDPTD